MRKTYVSLLFLWDSMNLGFFQGSSWHFLSDIHLEEAFLILLLPLMTAHKALWWWPAAQAPAAAVKLFWVTEELYLDRRKVLLLMKMMLLLPVWSNQLGGIIAHHEPPACNYLVGTVGLMTFTETRRCHFTLCWFGSLLIHFVSSADEIQFYF